MFQSPRIKDPNSTSLKYRSKNQSPSPIRSSLSQAKRFLEGVIVPDDRVPFFHGKITREYAERILLSKGTLDGSFLLRESINWNYAISICYRGAVHHYNIERQEDGSYRIPTGHLFPGPVELVQYHSCNLDGFLTLAKIPIEREPGESPIILTGISTGELEDHIKLKAVEMGLTGSNIEDALNGPMREHLQYLVLKDMHLYQSWFHDIIGRREAERRLARAGLYDGDFLVRLRKEDGTYVLSIVFHNEPKHYKIEKEFEHLSIEGGQKFTTLVELIDHYHFRQDGLLYKLKRGIHNPDFTRTRSGSNSISHERSLSPKRFGNKQMAKNTLDMKCHKIPMGNGSLDTRNSTQSLPSLGGSYPLGSQNTSPTSSSTSSQGGGQTINYKLHLLEKEKLDEIMEFRKKHPDQVSDLINLSDWPNLTKNNNNIFNKNPKPLDFLNEEEIRKQIKAYAKDGLQHTPFTPPTPMPNSNEFTTPTPQNCNKNPLDLVPLPPPPANLTFPGLTLNQRDSEMNPVQNFAQPNCIRPSKVQSNLGPHTADLTATVDALVQMTFSGKKNLSNILPTDNSLHSAHILDTNWEEPESSESNFSMSSLLNHSSIANNPTNPFNVNQGEMLSNLSSVSSFLSSNPAASANTSRQISIMSTLDSQQGIYDQIPITTFQLNRDQLTLKERLGGGNFGHVVRGIYQPSFGGEIPVAVKTLKESSMVLAEEKEILAEAKTMSQLRHRNIVRLIGICKDHHFMLVLELARLGPINKYLRKHQDFPITQIAELMSQVAQGMAYLESCKFVHRDLAARNVLLVNREFAKISDFGMSKALNMGSDYYQSKNAGKWPLKWYAPECIYYYRFDSKSDVWSYGITLWECFSYGDKPYKDMKGTEILAMLDEGGRLKKPANCPDAFYDVMLSCWQFDGTDRPSFAEIVPLIQRICKNI